ncbi:MAG: PBP1A family penicillin-binding protein [Deltaproteobacteria bacterium]|nr:PBP1A family penicillin-binding protein [Deltaproteobacteria bacterium]
MKKLLIILLCLFVISVLAALGAAVGAYKYFSRDLPRIATMKDYRPALVSQVFSEDGQLIGEFFVERRYPVDLSAVAPVMIDAILAAEDDRFFEHQGISLWSIVRAAFANLRSREIRQGGSTITQQVVKSLLLTPERSYTRKIKEAILATRIEQSLAKEDILTLYLNQIYFGRGAYGVEAAARVFFDKPASALNLVEASYLAALPKAPSFYSRLDRARERQHYVLQRMAELDRISPEQLAQALATDPQFRKAQNVTLSAAPHFVEFVRRELEKTYGADVLYKEGLRVETTLNLERQRAADAAVALGMENYETRQKKADAEGRVQAALVSLDPYSGSIFAMVGGRDYHESQFNRAVQAKRQPGSSFKPIIYAAALDKGYTAASIIVDSPVVFEAGSLRRRTFWEPQNYDRKFMGPITLRKALTLSRNVVTVKILQDIGIDYALGYARALGLDGDYTHGLSLALGSCGVSLINLVKAYGAFCAEGVYAEPVAITRIVNRDGVEIARNRPKLVSALSPQTAYIMTTLLQSVVEEGTGKKVRALNRPCAGKTGTTNDVRDAWFIGYTPDVVTGVWVGFDDLRPLGRSETGAVAAAPIWLDFMQKVYTDEPVRSFRIPDGLVFERINPKTGYAPQSKSEPAIFECFKEGTQPIRFIPAPLTTVFAN